MSALISAASPEIKGTVVNCDVFLSFRTVVQSSGVISYSVQSKNKNATR